MRIIWICNEFPFPPTHGGRVDVWRRVQALRHAGAEIFLVCWVSGDPAARPDAAQLQAVREQVAGLHVFTMPSSRGAQFKKLMQLWRWPSHAALRVLDENSYKALHDELVAFQGKAVWLDAPFGGVLAGRLADDLGLPLYYRSHNIEHLYLKRQLAMAKGFLRRLAIRLNLMHLSGFERGLLARAKAYFDISQDDLAFWKEQGFSRGFWLPPLVDEAFAQRLSDPVGWAPEYDVGYLGNLFSPNNIDGVLWLLREVIPKLRQARPELRAFIAGSNPVQAIRDAAAAAGVTLIENAPDAVAVLRNARVLVNPVFAGSGVNVKSVEMLFSPAGLVSSSIGVGGLPQTVRQLFTVADTPEPFVAGVLALLRQGQLVAEARRERSDATGVFSQRQGLFLLAQLQD